MGTFVDDEVCVYFLYLNFKHDFLNLNKRHKSHNTCFAFHPLLRPLSNVYLRQLDVSVIPSRSLEFPFRSNSRRVSFCWKEKTDHAHCAKYMNLVKKSISDISVFTFLHLRGRVKKDCKWDRFFHLLYLLFIDFFQKNISLVLTFAIHFLKPFCTTKKHASFEYLIDWRTYIKSFLI